MRNCSTDCVNEQTNIVDKIRGLAIQPELITGIPQLKYYTEQRQDGQAQVLTWHSDNGSGYDKYNYVVNITSPLGVNIISTQPFVDTTEAYPTISVADVQGRIVEKITDIGDLTDTSNTTSNCQLQTIYDHKGGITGITASYSGDCSIPVVGSLIMSRSYDATGKLLSTTDAERKDDDPGFMGNTVSYKYDASGNPSRLIDAEGNTIFTSFDALGRKQTVNDPNMGIKDFSYNGFGEVIEQKYRSEAYSTYYEYDILGRIVRQYSNVDTDKQPIDQVRSYADSYVYDSLVLGQLTSVTRESNLSDNACGSNCFGEHYKKE